MEKIHCGNDHKTKNHSLILEIMLNSLLVRGVHYKCNQFKQWSHLIALQLRNRRLHAGQELESTKLSPILY